jgi:hypothetical protein
VLEHIIKILLRSCVAPNELPLTALVREDNSFFVSPVEGAEGSGGRNPVGVNRAESLDFLKARWSLGGKAFDSGWIG